MTHAPTPSCAAVLLALRTYAPVDASVLPLFAGRSRLPPPAQTPTHPHPPNPSPSHLNHPTPPACLPVPQVTRIHAELPPGGVLVFLTGQREVEQLCKRLRNHYAVQRARREAGGAAGGGDEGGAEAEAEVEVDEEAELVEQYGGGGGDGAEVAGDAAERRRRAGGGEEEIDDYGVS